MDFDIVPAHLAVEAMRDNGYKNTAYAVAELMDNAIQAKAKLVELLCGEKVMEIRQRRRSRIHQLAVLDNGTGMAPDVLRIALQFGNGQYLKRENRTGMGRFGMGLPNSSISQCKRVDVWTWQDGVENAIYSYLDVEAIKKGSMREVPEPIEKRLPEKWLRVGKGYGKSGTLVVWSQIDRCIWRSASAIIKNSEFLVGRMYRKFLDNNGLTIRLVAFDWEHPETVVEEREASPNDPGYMMAATSCPAPYDNTPMFEAYGNYEVPFTIEFEDEEHVVYVRFSHAKEGARKVDQAGSTPYGRHAAKNVGVSVVRAGRELDLDQSCVIQYDPRERWWGVEVEFPPSLDELFGVTNNKQAARHFAELLATDIESLLEGKSITQLKAELLDEEDPKGPLLEVASKIASQLSVMRRLIKAQTKGTRSANTRHADQQAERRATEVTKERQSQGFKGESDKDEQLPEEERKAAVTKGLVDEGFSESEAEELTAQTLNVGLKYVWTTRDLESPAFFSVKPRGGEIIIILNMNHPAYKNLVEILDEDLDSLEDIDELKERLARARNGIRLLLMAWARFEDEQPDGIRREAVQDNRTDWGRIARQFLNDDGA